MSKLLTETSKFLSYVLRHEPQSIGLSLDTEGWANIDALIVAAAEHRRTLDRLLIEQVVATSEKKRFALSADGSSIRAVQGHSTDSVAISFEERIPPTVLYHGTATRFLESIRIQGLLPGSRHYVHLSEDMETAISVGQRYGELVVLTIAASAMHNQGVKFFQAQNGVWLVSHVPPGQLI
jgi:putative RNA 2'-phosphotransferase